MTTIPTNGAAPTAGVEAATEGETEATPLAPEPSEAAPTPEEPDKHLELARKFEGVAKREARARKLEAEHQAKLQALTEKEKALDAKLADLETALGDPIDWAMKRGDDPVELAKRFVKPESEEEKEIKAIKKELREWKEAEAKKLAEQEARFKAQQRHQSLVSFVSKITPDEAPNLTSLYEAKEVPQLLEELLHRPVGQGNTMLTAFQEKYGRNPTDTEIIECLEYEAEERATRILARHRSGQDENAPPQETAPQSQTRGLSNQHAGVTNSARKPPLSKEERRKQAREEITRALEAESAGRRSE
jgi:hypothetical protein